MIKSRHLAALLVVSVVLVGGCAKTPTGEKTVKQETYEEKVQQLNESQKQIEKLKNRAGNLEQSLASRNERVEELEAKEEQLEKLRQQNKELQKSLSDLQDVEARREGDNVVMTLGAEILFELGDYKLKPEARRKLDRLAEVIGSHEDRPVVVEGHSCTVPVIPESRFPNNRLLSAARAVSVTEYLTEEHGLSAKRFFAGGYGQHDPVVPNTSPENRAQNRRVEIVFLPPELEERKLGSTMSDTE